MYSYRCAVVRIIDGDTLELDIDLGFHVHQRSVVRMLGYDAPEMSGPDGEDAKGLLSILIGDGPLTCRTIPDRRGDDRADGFRRYLVDLYAGADSINAAMIKTYGPYKPKGVA